MNCALHEIFHKQLADAVLFIRLDRSRLTNLSRSRLM